MEGWLLHRTLEVHLEHEVLDIGVTRVAVATHHVLVERSLVVGLKVSK